MVKTKEGFTIVSGKRNDSKIIFRKNGVYISKSYIPYTHTSSTIVYFVSGSNGDEYGQFTNKKSALKKARKMAKLSLQERRKFDE